MHHNLVKECPWREELTSPSKRGVGPLLNVAHLTMKEHPCYINSNSMLSKQIIWQTKRTTEPPAASSQGLMAHHTLSSTTYVTMSSGWVLIRVNIDPIQEFGPKVGGRHPFKGGLFHETMI